MDVFMDAKKGDMSLGSNPSGEETLRSHLIKQKMRKPINNQSCYIIYIVYFVILHVAIEMYK